MNFDLVNTFLFLHTLDSQVSSPAEYWTMLVGAVIGLLLQQCAVMLAQANDLSVNDCPHYTGHRMLCFPLLLWSGFMG